MGGGGGGGGIFCRIARERITSDGSGISHCAAAFGDIHRRGDVRAGFQTAIQEDPIRRNFYEIVSAVPVSGFPVVVLKFLVNLIAAAIQKRN
jgi:hypothetical protein